MESTSKLRYEQAKENADNEKLNKDVRANCQARADRIAAKYPSVLEKPSREKEEKPEKETKSKKEK